MSNKRVGDILSEKQKDYSAKKKIIEPLLFKLNNMIQNINSIIFETTPYKLTESDATELFKLVFKIDDWQDKNREIDYDG